MRNRKKNNIKDYIIPAITFILIFSLMYITFSGGENEKKNIEGNNSVNNKINSSITVLLGDEKTEATKIKKNKEKKDIKNNSTLNIGEQLNVEKGYLSFEIPNIAKFSLNGIAEKGAIEYNKKGTIKLISSSLWVETKDTTNILATYGEINLGKNSIANIKQTELTSTFYLIKGEAQIKSNGNSIKLNPGEEIEIEKDDNKNTDLKKLKKNLSPFFKTNSWTRQNNLGSPLGEIEKTLEENTTELNTETGSTLEIKKRSITTSNTLLNFDNFYDEGFTETAITNISGNFIDDEINKITINGKTANINSEKKIFNVLGVNTSKKTNDLIIKIYNKENDLIGKSILTLNYEAGNKQKENLFSEINTKPFPVKSEDFIVSVPTVINGKTYSNKNTFYGTVKNPNVKIVKVNGYALKTFNGKTFRYHAFKKYNNLGEGVNIYKIEYFNKNGILIFEKYVTIDKISKIKIKKISGEKK